MKKFYKEKNNQQRECIVYYYMDGICTAYWADDCQEIIFKDIKNYAYTDKVYHLFLHIF